MELAALLTTESPGVRAVSVIPNEIVLPSTRLRIDLRYPAPRDRLRESVSVTDAAGRVRVTNKGRTVTWTPLRPLQAGVHRP